MKYLLVGLMMIAVTSMRLVVWGFYLLVLMMVHWYLDGDIVDLLMDGLMGVSHGVFLVRRGIMGFLIVSGKHYGEEDGEYKLYRSKM